MRKRCQKCPLPEVLATQPGRMNPQTRGQGTTTQHCGTPSGGAALCQGQSHGFTVLQLYSNGLGQEAPPLRTPEARKGKREAWAWSERAPHKPPILLYRTSIQALLARQIHRMSSLLWSCSPCLQAHRLHLHRERTRTGRLCVLPPRREPTSQLNAALLNCQGTWGHEAKQ